MIYQWSFNGTNLAAATNATLTLPNVSLEEAGWYQVVVTNQFGQAISSPAVLTVLTVASSAARPTARWSALPAAGFSQYA